MRYRDIWASVGIANNVAWHAKAFWSFNDQKIKVGRIGNYKQLGIGLRFVP